MSPKAKSKLEHAAARRAIHPAVKTRLGYAADEPDAEVLRDWRARLRRVCKPCWELKYCPYGPLVEQSPLLPAGRAGMVEHVERLKRMLSSGQLGEIEELTDERRKFYERCLGDEELLALQALYEMREEENDARIAASADPGAEFEQRFRGELPPIHEYRVPFNVAPNTVDLGQLGPGQRKTLRARIRERKRKLRDILRDGIEDARRPLDAGRRASFEKDG